MRNKTREAYFFIAPLVVVIFTFIIIPVLGTFYTSLFRDVAYLPLKFIGFKNYLKMVFDSNCHQSILFTLIFSIVSVSLEIVIGLIFALLLNEKFRLRGVMCAVILIPWAIPIIISARTWELIYNYNYGILNFILLKSGIISSPVNFMGTAISAFLSILLADVWKTVPFVTLILLAGLQAIPGDLYEQAKIDGASIFKSFFKITLPILKHVILIALIFRTIDTIRIFDIIYVLTKGGPGGATSSLTMYGYKYFLSGDFGYGSAVSIATFVIAFVFTIIYLKVGKLSIGKAS
ncbi:MAG: sugar ABC transporter permease [Elusimicrobia bacterium]|nr:sugar ABC transporter permease [Elusimicrobiota bacterium]